MFTEQQYREAQLIYLQSALMRGDDDSFRTAGILNNAMLDILLPNRAVIIAS